MNQSTIRATALLGIAIAIIAIGYLYQNHQMSLANASKTVIGATSSNAIFAPVTKSDTQGGSTNIIPIEDSAISAQTIYKKPTYSKTLTFSLALSGAEKAAIQSDYTEAIGLIATDALDFNAWISVGTMNLMAGNYKKAEEIWQYASTQWPSNHASHNNLGDLYMNYLKDYAKAEKEFVAAIKNFPGDPNPYRNLFTLYSETSYKPTNTAAEDILKQGIAAVSKAPELQYLLAKYYVKLGRPEDAQVQYQAAINNATSLGQTHIANQIKAEAGIK